MEQELNRLQNVQFQLNADKSELKERINALEKGSLTYWYATRRGGNMTCLLVATLFSLAITAISAPSLWEKREAQRLATHQRGEFFFGPVDYLGLLVIVFFLSTLVAIIPLKIAADWIIMSKGDALLLEKQQDIDYLKREFEKRL